MPPPPLLGPIVVALGAGVVLLVRGVWRWRRTRVTSAWRTAEGQVVRAELHRAGATFGRTSPHPMPAVRVAYTVDGRSHEVWFEHTRVEYDDRDAGAELAARFPLGRPLLVRYDPARPAHGVVEGDHPWRGYGSMLGGLALLLLGLVLLFGARGDAA